MSAFTSILFKIIIPWPGRIYPEDGGSRFLHKIGKYLPDYKTSFNKRQQFS
jgi:hypothetical protein